MGKTAKGALWLDSEKTSVYEFYQYFRNTADADVIPFLKRLTFVPLEEIAAMEAFEGSQLNDAKERLAVELTALVHGEAEALKARDTAKSLFSGSGISDNMPTTIVEFDGDLTLIDALVNCGLSSSKSDARRVIEQGGVEVDGKKIDSIQAVLTKKQCEGGGCVIKRGKKLYHRVRAAG